LFNNALLAKWKWRLVSNEQGNGKIFFSQNMARCQGEVISIQNFNLVGGETYLKYVVRESKKDGSKKL